MTTVICLGHKVLDVLPRGEDGERLTEAIRHRIADVLSQERKACADIAHAIDSGRGNEKEIAKAILCRGEENSSAVS